MKKLWLAFAMVVTMATAAQAIPALQLYIEGATYDNTTETWVKELGGDPATFKLWVIGDVGAYGTIYDVKLSAAYPTATPGWTFGWSSTTATGITDPSVPIAAQFTQLGADGTVPVTGDGSPLAPHGIYGTGTSWLEFYLGDFTLTDSPIGDFMTDFPTDFPDMGQINAYEITVDGFDWIHFDAYDHIFVGQNNAKYVFAPFSHDAGGDGDDGGGGGGNPVPEPSTVVLLGSGLVGLVLIARKRRSS